MLNFVSDFVLHGSNPYIFKDIHLNQSHNICFFDILVIKVLARPPPVTPSERNLCRRYFKTAEFSRVGYLHTNKFKKKTICGFRHIE